ncbi:MAG: SOS response-associated peptidase [Proteobacteria bacterium]|nr:SOS response-associated peptidase [Pseudomonadota bacterium]
MCGRFAFYSPSEATAALFGVATSTAVVPHYNIAPSQYIAAIRNASDAGRELVMLRWGLLPFWAKDPGIGNRMINARMETVAEKPSFRAAYRQRRCLVLADGFYEWKQDDGGKTPYFVSLANGTPFAFAALWENWQARDSDENVQSTALITTAANDFMAAVHHRMPIILQPDTADRWLAGDNAVLADVSGNSPELRAWPVNRRVNNARNDDADLTTRQDSTGQDSQH